ncbi:MAG: VWA domain-containing protein [Acidimicrobiia bacterium]|nr:VWA domain-containing protein [Acidimicrobiia bacterium]
MSFLSPLFLAALAGLAIPVLIHLIQREKKRVVVFPSLMFLQRIPYQSIRRRHIHNWLLLCVRLAVLLLIVLAFARPFLERSERVAASSGSREVVVLLDRSYSMGYQDRWAAAQAAAREAIEGLDSSDRASVVLFGTAADVAVRSSGDRGRLLAAVDAARPTASATRYAPAMKVASTILAESGLPRLEAVLISDFQRAGWQGSEALQLPAAATITPVPVGGLPGGAANAAVTGVSLDRSTFSSQERVTLTAVVASFSPEPMTVPVALDVEGRTIQTETVTLPPGERVSVSFAPVTLTGRNTRATISLAPDGLDHDNRLHVAISPLELLRVLVLDRGGRGDASLYLRRALDIGERPRFEATVRPPDAVPEDLLSRAAVVVVNDVEVDAGLAGRLQRFVEQGGGLFVAAGARTSWPGSSGGWLPASLAGPVDRRNAASRLAGVEYGHRLFEVFRGPRSGDFSVARFFGYRAATAAADARVLARFDAGSPALVERSVGRGRVLLWTSSLDLEWNDLPLKPVFLPFVHGAVTHLAAYAVPSAWLTVGQVLDPAAAAPALAAETATVLSPSGVRVPVEDGEVFELAEQGFYEIRDARGGGDVVLVAGNVDTAESDLTPLDPQDIAAAATADPSSARAFAQSAPISPEAQEGSQRFWWYLLCLAVLLLGADTLLSNRLSRAHNG